jgi:hypothetical protein
VRVTKVHDAAMEAALRKKDRLGTVRAAAPLIKAAELRRWVVIIPYEDARTLLRQAIDELDPEGLTDDLR